MQITPPWTYIRPDETDILGLDFKKDLLGATIVSTTWTCRVVSGEDATPSSRLAGLPSVNGTISQQKVTGMLVGVIYDLEALVVTSDGRTLSLDSTIECQNFFREYDP